MFHDTHIEELGVEAEEGGSAGGLVHSNGKEDLGQVLSDLCGCQSIKKKKKKRSRHNGGSS